MTRFDGKPIEIRFDAAKEFNSFTVATFVNPNDWRYVNEDERQAVIEKILYDGHVIVQQLRKVTSISPLTIWENFFGYLLWHYHMLLSNPGLADQAMEDIEILENPKTWSRFSQKSWWAEYTGGQSPTNLVNIPVRKSCCFSKDIPGLMACGFCPLKKNDKKNLTLTLKGNESANKIAKSLGLIKRQFLNGLSNMNTMVLELLFSHIQITH